MHAHQARSSQARRGRHLAAPRSGEEAAAKPGREALKNAGGEPVVVVTGRLHVAELHQRLNAEATTIAMTTVHDEGDATCAETPYERKQLSYVYAKPDEIRLLRPAMA